MQVQPYLFFGGRCEEAIEFYRRALGAQVEGIMRWKDNPEQQPGTLEKGFEDKVMHAAFRIGETLVMASDGDRRDTPGFQGFALSISVRDEAEANRVFDAIAEGGKVQMPLTKTFFSPAFGMAADRFGVSWMVVVMPA